MKTDNANKLADSENLYISFFKGVEKKLSAILIIGKVTSHKKWREPMIILKL